MFEYEIDILEINDPHKDDLVEQMNDYGKAGWEIFNIAERVIKEWRDEYEGESEKHKIVEYTIYMKRKI